MTSSVPTTVTVTLEVDRDDADPKDRTGLTVAAHDRLVDALADAGFGIVEGPRRVAIP